MSDWLSYKYFVYVIGFAAQILFSARLLLQWIQSEKVKKVLTPELFWQLSLIASFLLFIYGWLRDDFAIMLGQSLTYFIYIRNMQLQGSWKKLPNILRGFLLAFPFLIAVYSFNNNQIDVERLFRNEDIPFKLLLWGSIGQIIFTLRFVYQWIYSERKKESALPFGFWMLSLIGSLMILSYAIIRKDPVLFIGQLFGFIIYSRNIYILLKHQK
ncbi:lipid-A-disaccharide synthase N-terminal domain-containing protein [Aureibaculum sp. 2210JD6-5]|uniref:lipid-A-disaccharide synthase N-terminal domain-containing protein n=1 Tax=Aureibaculum sp. 2210JD6-5 TaxID=3103957 RepID=UPI002AACA8BA|nr:lipid-A-disaccharide synthase N-terminal domain-containing protein [Aureibaculum sp. 2210JD6-5]MDY7393671.1 lipid-A-disaccharide synthase N-terminal domain-containing protein [Aureibaculum sp. 2210JD6-5]